MSETPAFSDPESVLAMEAEHLPLWRAFIRAFAPLLPAGARILDFGCNRGGLLVLLCREGLQATPVIPPAGPGSFRLSLGVGIDVDTPAMRALLKAASEAARGRHPLLFTISGPETFPGQFDLVVSHEVVYLLPDLTRTFTGIHSALAPGGRFCFATGCHTENPLFPLWSASLRDLGVEVHAYSTNEYERSLLESGFTQVARDRLLLSSVEYDAWVRDRESPDPNPAWFPSASSERTYYTRTGKLLLTGVKV